MSVESSVVVLLFFGSRQNTWIVLLQLETTMRVDCGLKAIENMSAFSSPLLNSYNFLPVEVSNILINVPLMDAVATNDPSLDNEIQVRLDVCA